jgi:lipid-A-disaccharide synthase
MKYYLIAGEASGDLHGSNLMNQLKLQDHSAEFRFWGGDKMQEVGGYRVEHYKNTAFMGFLEVVKNLFTILNFIKKCKADIADYQPDVLILIDYPGFNLRIAKWAKSKHIKVVYYIVPQVWAWHKSRVHDLGKYTDLMLVILPFEQAFFKSYGYETTYVGHPLLDAIHDFKPDPSFKEKNQLADNIIALLPGSRMQEIKKILPEMLQACQNTEFQIALACAPSFHDEVYQDIVNDQNLAKHVTLIRNATYELLSVAKLALVTSGTATLETALFKVPQIVCYKGSSVSYYIAKKLVNLKYISLVNLIADKAVVKELIQDDLSPENIKKEISSLTNNRQLILNEYADIAEKLGSAGASAMAASCIVQLLH